MMVTGDKADQLVTKRDIIHLALIIIAAFVVGLYLILTTVLISKDGTFYIEQAKKFQTDPIEVIKGHPFGYPFLIFLFHKLAMLFTDSQSIYVWIYSAQAANLFCRLLSLIPLYFIGKLMVGSKTSFVALLLLVILPYPAQYGSDVLRDWPHILFLVSGFLFLLLGAGQNKCWMFGAAGFLAGLGFMVRLECIQLLIYGILWLCMGLFSPHSEMNRSRIVCALFVLLIGFLIPAASYIAIRGDIPFSLEYERVVSLNTLEQIESHELRFKSGDNIYTASSLPVYVGTLNKIFCDIADNLMYFFLPVWLIGIYYRFHRQDVASGAERFFLPVFIAVNIFILIFLFSSREYLSRRYSVPLVVITIFYVPVGLWVLSDRLGRIFFQNRLEADRHYQYLLLILLGIGVSMCSLRLFRPIRPEKLNYLLAAQWLEDNSGEDDVVGVPDSRISFYAERKGKIYKQEISEDIKYVVSIMEPDQKSWIEDAFPGVRKVFNRAGEDKKPGVLIYDMRGYISEGVCLDGYQWEKVGEEKYRLSFIFKTKVEFAKDWVIFIHGVVKKENINYLPPNRRQYQFENWDFNPEPPTSVWPVNDLITVTREITAQPISYDIYLGFYTAEGVLYGRRINLGWIDFGKAEKGSQMYK